MDVGLERILRAEVNQSFVRGKVAERGWTEQVESMAALAIACGYRTWWTCQLHMDLEDLGLGLDKKGAELTKALLKASPKIRSNGEWAS